MDTIAKIKENALLQVELKVTISPSSRLALMAATCSSPSAGAALKVL
jgi:hypothetical protein